ncbi:alanine--glyoxylate aminotransferase family protein [Pontibacter sp. G13]|uniref:pyridoxal-phosphate-dependent aminotransferase family protein n=1 Tax=Pontibacter sp. G13 TaxID=3074898 RepID=UPI00288A4BC7|nr:alanine--glyoxylate aminotransferase family protein [Pontibacter sp. G13]WNJ21471.1 alanine--glyoxylate aminotransferase family protein [Pontibacter sp. G13]
MPKHLLTPGPVPIPSFVMEAISQPVIHHRTPEFRSFYQELLSKLQYYFQTDSSTGTMIGSGTFGVECAIYSMFRPGDSVAVVDMGKFSNRWNLYAQLCSLKVHPLELAWGKAPNTQEIVAFVAQHSPKGIVLTHSETSTGTCLDLEEIAWQLRKAHPDLLIVVDAITSVGAQPYYHDAWGIDCSLAASQKALFNPTGLVAFALSERAKNALVPTDSADFRNFYNYLASAQTGDYPFTAPVNLLYGLNAALQHIEEVGLPALWRKTHLHAQTFRKALEEMGGVVRSEFPSETLTAFHFPDKDNESLRQDLWAQGFELAGGQGSWKNHVLRLSHMYPSDMEVLESLISTLRAMV